MTPPSSKDSPYEAPPRWLLVTGGIFILVLAAVGVVHWQNVARQEALDQFASEGIIFTETPLWDKAGRSWPGFLRGRTWAAWYVGDATLHRRPPTAGSPSLPPKIRNLDPFAPALGRINPDCLLLSGYPFTELKNLDALKDMTRLRWLELSKCLALQNVDGIKDLTRLEYVWLDDCHQVQNLDGLQRLSKLKEVHVWGCAMLRSIDGLKGLPNLERVSLLNCDSLESVEAIAELPKLRRLEISGSNAVLAKSLPTLKATHPAVHIEHHVETPLLERKYRN
jgi:hypothetical protein